MTTTAEIRRVFPHASEEWLIEIVNRAPKAGIDTRNELASFLAQAGHETRGFTRFEENLNYTVGRLMAVWPRRFPSIESAMRYAHQPVLLAERVYGGRMGNTQPGDAWLYRGRGLPMLTGRRNYRLAGDGIGLDLLEHPDWLAVPSLGTRIALWCWRAVGLDAMDDDADAKAETHVINGGEIGLPDRQTLLDQLLQVLT